MFDEIFFNYYNTLNAKDAHSIHIFQKGDLYGLFGQDAKLINRYIDIGLSNKTVDFGCQTYEYIIFQNNIYEKIINYALNDINYIVYQHTYERCWKASTILSPGKYSMIDDNIPAQNLNLSGCQLIAVNISCESQLILGIACLDNDSNIFKILEIMDDVQLSQFENIISWLMPKECLIPSNLQTYSLEIFNKVTQISHSYQMLLTNCLKSNFLSDNIVSDLNKLLYFPEGKSCNFGTDTEFTDCQLALTSLSAIIKYSDLLSLEGNTNIYNMERLTIDSYLRLDSAAINALNLFPLSDSGNTGEMKVANNLYDLLNRCQTAAGSRLLCRWIRQPFTNISIIEKRLDMVEALLHCHDLRKSLTEVHLRRIPDIQRITRKIIRRKSNLQDLYKLYKAITWLSHIDNAFKEAIQNYTSLTNNNNNNMVDGNDPDNIHKILTDFSDKIQQFIQTFHKFCQMVETMLNIERVENNHEYLIRAEFDEDLAELQERLDDIENKMQKHYRFVAKDLGFDCNNQSKGSQSSALKLENGPLIGYHFRITKKDEKYLRNVHHYRIIDTNKGGVRFRDLKLEDLNSQHAEAKMAYDEQQKIVLAEILNIAAGYMEPFMHLSDVLSEIDVLCSFSQVALHASSHTYVRPIIKAKEERIIDIKQARNPCLEIQEDINYIPNDVYFKQDDAHFYIVTGPNMGGKSTYIRTTGLLCVMAQIGCFLPCKDSPVISILDAIFCRVGAGDCQSKGISTFMGEMIETTTILKYASQYSLIIIDELGRGTSTFDGFGLAWAISEHIILNIQCFTYFATHFHELTNIAEEINGEMAQHFNPHIIKNVHVSALTNLTNDDENMADMNDNEQKALVLLYQVKPGPSDRSFGIDIAKMAKFPKLVIKMAEDKARELGDIYYDKNATSLMIH